MYQENKNFMIKDMIIKLLFVVLFVFLLMWIFPLPKDLKPFYDRIFNDNIMMIKNVAEDYYTNERLPKLEGDKTVMTLQQMYDKHLLLPFVDKNGKLCDAEASYVEITKEKTEHKMIVSLTCGSQTDYIVAYLGCHNLCGASEKECPVCECNQEEKKETVLQYQYKRTLIQGRKWTTSPVYSYEFTRQVGTQIQKPIVTEWVKGRKWQEPGTYTLYKYEYCTTVPGKTTTTTEYKYCKLVTTGSTTTYKTEYQYCELAKEYKHCKVVTTTSAVTYGAWYNIKYNGNTYEDSLTQLSTSGYLNTAQTQRRIYIGTVSMKACSQCDWYTTGYRYQRQERTKSGGVTTSAPDCSKGETWTSSTSAPSGYQYMNVSRNGNNFNMNKCQWGTKPPYDNYQWTGKTQQPATGTTGGVQTVDYSNCKTTTSSSTPSGYQYVSSSTSTSTGSSSKSCESIESTETSIKGWTRISSRQVTNGTGVWLYSDWVDNISKLPAGYTVYEKENRTTYKTETEYKSETTWANTSTLEGWTATGNKKLVSEGGGAYTYSGWVLTLQTGYEKYGDSKTEYTWSTKTSLGNGWVRTGQTKNIETTITPAGK